MKNQLFDALVLLEVYQKGSFRRAAAAIGTDQATVSRRMTALEKRVGAPLFTRGRRGVTPTEEGKVLLDAAGRTVTSMSAFQNAVAKLADRRLKTVRIAAPVALVAYMLGPAFGRVMPSSHPLAEQQTKVNWEELPKVNFLPPGTTSADIEVLWSIKGHGPSASMDNVIRRIGTVPWRPFASKGYVERKEGPNRFDEIHQHPVIEHTHNREDLSLAPWVNEIGRSNDGPMMTLPCTTAIIPLVAGGAGVALLPRVVPQLVPDLVEVGTEGRPEMGRDLWITANPDALKVPSIRRVFDAVITLLSAPTHIERS